MKYISLSTLESAFNCPHCEAFAQQQWYSLLANPLPNESPLPVILDSDCDEEITSKDVEDPKEREKLQQIMSKIVKGLPVFVDRTFEQQRSYDWYAFVELHNVVVAQCFNCRNNSVWIHRKLVFPQRGEAPPANADLSDDIRRDYDEAGSILDLSPRGAAALLRLAIQKLCKELGLSGNNLNEDIKKLVSKGLEKEVQMALDTIRVIGNNAVHPGRIDIQDDRSTAETMFSLLNLIAEKMITQPKRIKKIYATLPEEARKAIEKRDSGA